MEFLRQILPRRRVLALLVVFAIAAAAVTVWKQTFVRPDLNSGREVTPLNQTTDEDPKTVGEDGEAEPEPPEVDYGPGIRPRSEGTRKSEDFYTVLILGRDTAGGGQTDTMLLASYDVTNQKATVMSIPRDTMVNIPYDVKKINAVYNYYGQGEPGIRAVYREVAQLVGFEPDFQVVVEWDAVGKVVDAIGGVWFDNPYPMDYHDPKQDLVIEQEQGYRLLTGEDAMQVLRWRQNDNDSPYGYRRRNGGIGDAGRMELQQNFLKAVLHQMLTIQNVGNIGKLTQIFKESVETDLTFQNILWFARQALFGGLREENVEFLTMPWAGVTAWSRSYKSDLAYVVPQASALLEIVNEKLSPFEEEFQLSDLDIMSVRSDGSIRSSTGKVEDRQAASPPDR